jgi:large subunit ribosomal protein L31
LQRLCHPLYTGKSKVIDTAGRIDKFKQRMAKAKEIQAKTKVQKNKTKKKEKR